MKYIDPKNFRLKDEIDWKAQAENMKEIAGIVRELIRETHFGVVAKAAGEDAIMKEMNTYYIIRTAWLYGFDGRNFVYTMTKLMNSHDQIRVVNDQRGTPTFAPDLAAAILRFIEKSDNAKSFFGKNSFIFFSFHQ